MQTKSYYSKWVVFLTSWAIIQELYSTTKALAINPKHVDALASKLTYINQLKKNKNIIRFVC